MIDEQLLVRTPEGADLVLPLAGPLPRAAAYLVDLLIRAGAYMVLAFILAFLGEPGMGLLLIAIFALEWFYPVFFEAWWHGQTPGKRALGIAVVHADGTPLSFNGSLIRNLLRAADIFPFAYLTGLVTMLCSSRFQRLGDLAADTLVVHVHPGRGRDLPAMRTARALPDWPLTLADRQVLIGYAERAAGLTEGRRLELARQAFPEMDGPTAERHLQALAAGVVGQK